MWLEDGLNDDIVRAICGMGDIGKTTIAKIIYNQNLDSFDGSSFLVIGEMLKEPNGPLLLQRQLLSEISKREHGKIHNGTEIVEGLTFDMSTLKEVGNRGKKRNYEEFCDKSIFSMYANSLKQCVFSFISGQSIRTTTTSRNDVNLKTNAFKNMRKLRLLKLNYVQLAGSYEKFPKALEWLSWHGFPLKSIPIEFPLKNLVALDLSHSLPNLERLILKGCVRLVEVCESIGNLKMLDLLDLKDCKTLRKLPTKIGKLGSLKTLIISGCNIGELPSEMRNLTSLEVFKADGIVINPLQSSSEDIKWWQPIVWSRVPTPRKGLETLWASLPCSLRDLSLSQCSLSDDSFPVNFGDLPLLTRLNLSKNPFRSIPNCIRSLSGLTYLNMNECHALRLLDLNDLSINSGSHLDIHSSARTIPCSIYMGWLSKWRFGNQLEAGDEISITFDGDDGYWAEEVGFKFGYRCDQDKEEQENETSSSSSSTTEEENVHSHHDFPALRSSTGEYFLNRLSERQHNDYVLRFRERYYL
ncbi:hypothetical protein LguiB_021502 [Lonicera macranthoides]